ncbi:tlde1 domain-containing protein [Kalamiella sp. sgz302252]|uniref:tlde1 domain-containing protein n=1 Tax=Pantoea sp. sgz302252 TaxID=3341827 RepID=UPI0036D26F40
MAWIYQQSTGNLYHNGQYIARGYSGALTNKNNPDRQHVRGMGPIPRGRWHITQRTHSKGPATIVLNQVSGETFGRTAFRIHGERVDKPAGFASQGCIILNLFTRERIWSSQDRILEVVR